MSAEATGWVFRFSPFRGVAFAVHLAAADSVNDQYDNEFWLPTGKTATKARCGRPAVSRAIGMMVDQGFLTMLEAPVFGGGAKRRAARYRFEFPRVPIRYDSRADLVSPGDKDLVSPGDKEPPDLVSRGDKPLSREDTQNPREPNQQPRARSSRNRTQIPDPFVLSDADLAWAAAKTPTVDVTDAAEEFVTYWRGRGDVRADWSQTFRNRLQRLKQRQRGAA